MRWFWGLILLAAIAGAALMLRGGGEGGAGQAVVSTTTDERAAAPKSERATPAKAETTAAAKSDSADTTPGKQAAVPVEVAVPTPMDSKAASDPPGVRAVPPTTVPPAVTEPVPQVKASESTSAPEKHVSSTAAKSTEQHTLENALDAALGIKGEEPFVGPMPEGATAMTPKAADVGASSAPAAKAEGGKDASTTAKDSAKAKLVEQPDGSVLVDDQYVIKGKGTETEPFIVTWEMLVSAKDTYQPRLGRKIIPDRLQMISGKWVKISGFIAFPLMAQSQDEMLMMLNQWDGCCIGVPPEPYDAIEVKLKKAVLGDDRMRVSGWIKGILRVDPYLIKDWLVSLYLMDDAELFKDEKAPVRQAGMHKGGLAGPEGDGAAAPK